MNCKEASKLNNFKDSVHSVDGDIPSLDPPPAVFTNHLIHGLQSHTCAFLIPTALDSATHWYNVLLLAVICVNLLLQKPGRTFCKALYMCNLGVLASGWDLGILWNLSPIVRLK